MLSSFLSLALLAVAARGAALLPRDTALLGRAITAGPGCLSGLSGLLPAVKRCPSGVFPGVSSIEFHPVCVPVILLVSLCPPNVPVAP